MAWRKHILSFSSHSILFRDKLALSFVSKASLFPATTQRGGGYRVSNNEDFEISGLAHTDEEGAAADGKDSLRCADLLPQVRSPLSPSYSYRGIRDSSQEKSIVACFRQKLQCGKHTTKPPLYSITRCTVTQPRTRLFDLYSRQPETGKERETALDQNKNSKAQSGCEMRIPISF